MLLLPLPLPRRRLLLLRCRGGGGSTAAVPPRTHRPTLPPLPAAPRRRLLQDAHVCQHRALRRLGRRVTLLAALCRQGACLPACVYRAGLLECRWVGSGPLESSADAACTDCPHPTAPAGQRLRDWHRQAPGYHRQVRRRLQWPRQPALACCASGWRSPQDAAEWRPGDCLTKACLTALGTCWALLVNMPPEAWSVGQACCPLHLMLAAGTAVPHAAVQSACSFKLLTVALVRTPPYVVSSSNGLTGA